MESLLYYLTYVFTLISIAFGVFLFVFGIFDLIKKGINEPTNRIRSISRLLSGATNILLGTTFYQFLAPDSELIYLMLATLIAFGLWEWFARAYFIET